MMDQFTWQTYLSSSHAIDAHSAEKALRQALTLAEKEYGTESAEAGLCLIELADMLEALGRKDEAEQATERYRRILAELARNLGLCE